MDSELEQSFQLCVSLLQSFPQQVSQHHQQSSQSLSHQLVDFQYKAERINEEMREMEEKLREVRGEQQEERGKGLVLMGELEQLKAAKDSEAPVLQERSQNLTEKSEELSVRSGQLKQEIEYLASKLSLYCNFTRISWDYESTSTLSGQILVHPQKQSFSFPLSQPRGKPSFDQVNELWTLMD